MRFPAFPKNPSIPIADSDPERSTASNLIKMAEVGQWQQSLLGGVHHHRIFLLLLFAAQRRLRRDPHRREAIIRLQSGTIAPARFSSLTSAPLYLLPAELFNAPLYRRLERGRLSKQLANRLARGAEREQRALIWGRTGKTET